MLEVEEIDVFYGPVQALRGLSLQVGEGEMVALLGANGAGKSTTLRAISGLLSPAKGSIRLNGKDIGGRPAHKVVRLGVAHMPEGRELFPEMTVLENLRLGHWSRRKQSKALAGRIERVFDLFPRLKERSSQTAQTLSGGEQQMLTAGRALMSDPAVLLADELSLGLAPKLVAQLFQAIGEVNRQGTAVLVVEQFIHKALANTDRAYVLAKGEVVLEGRSSELSESKDLLSSYLGEVSETEDSEGAGGQESYEEHPAPVTAHGGDLPAGSPSEAENGRVPESRTPRRPRPKSARKPTSKSSRSTRKAKQKPTETEEVSDG